MTRALASREVHKIEAPECCLEPSASVADLPVEGSVDVGPPVALCAPVGERVLVGLEAPTGVEPERDVVALDAPDLKAVTDGLDTAPPPACVVCLSHDQV